MYNTRKPREKSALIFVLKGLIPYTEANLMLAFKPSRFFAELEKISDYKRHTLEVAFYEAQKQELIKLRAKQNKKILEITELGRKVIRSFVAEKLNNNGRLMVIFDIPEDISKARARLRRALRSWNFEAVQKSVWITAYDHKQSVKDLVKELGIEPYVLLFECAPA